MPLRGGPCAAERRHLCREEALCAERRSLCCRVEAPVSRGGPVPLRGGPVPPRGGRCAEKRPSVLEGLLC